MFDEELSLFFSWTLALVGFVRVRRNGRKRISDMCMRVHIGHRVTAMFEWTAAPLCQSNHFSLRKWR